MPQSKTFNLFVYGTLMNPGVFRAVLGRRLVFSSAEADGKETFLARDAILQGYKKISPDQTYMYAVPDRQWLIRGYFVGMLPSECMSSLRRYEGRNYSRRKVKVDLPGEGEQEAIMFVGNLKQLEHSFGYAFHDPLKQEILLREKIDRSLGDVQQQRFGNADPDLRRAMQELHGPTIRDLIRRHFEASGIGDYAIRTALREAHVPDYSRLRDDSEADALAPNYLSLVIRQVIFNQLEDRIRADFRYELDRLNPDGEFYERSVSCLLALRMLNRAGPLLPLVQWDCLHEHGFQRDDLVDFIRWAIVAADNMYDLGVARSHLQHVQAHRRGGHIALGAELEFSNIGHEVIRDPRGQKVRDCWFDGFLYFHEFALDALTWKLGGHIDDHHEKFSPRQRRGFFELALGSLSIEANISKPACDDPWLLNQLIHECMAFYPVVPHSVHISLQLRSQHKRIRERILPLAVLKCLMAVAGDPQIDDAGRLRITRLEEIVRLDQPPEPPADPHQPPRPQRAPTPHIIFSDTSKRRSSEAEEFDLRHPKGLAVQQYKFLRLCPSFDYEAVVMGLKGLQLSLSPGTFLTPSQYKFSRRCRDVFTDLVDWCTKVEPIPEQEVEAFLGHVYDGLMTERRGTPAHSETYISSSLGKLRTMLEQFNILASANAGE